MMMLAVYAGEPYATTRTKAGQRILLIGIRGALLA
jgi:hypothetical protein